MTNDSLPQGDSSIAPKMPVEDGETGVDVVRTRRGRVRMSYESIPRDRYRSWVIIEGTREAVMCAVVLQMEGCTECYEHMFTVSSIEDFGHLWRAKCIRNNYAGD